MIPYLPEGPPPLDEDEDVGSPVDAPVGFQGVLHSITAAVDTPFGDFAAAFPTPQPPQSPNEAPTPSAEETEKEQSTIGEEESAPLEKLSSDSQQQEVPEVQPSTLANADTVSNSNDAFDADFDDFQSAEVLEEQSRPPEDEDEKDIFAGCDENENNAESVEDTMTSCQTEGENEFDNHEDRFEFTDDGVVKTPVPEDLKPSDLRCDESSDCASPAEFVLRTDGGGNALTSVGNEVWEKENADESGMTADDDDFGDFNSTTVESETFKEASEMDSVEDKEGTDLSVDFPTAENHVGDQNGMEDDFDGFQEFGGSDNKCEEAEDDFGDFGNFSEQNFFQETDVSGEVVNDEFGNFSQPDEWQNSSPACPTFDETVEFASFEKSNQITIDSSNNINGKPAGLLEKILANMETVLTTCFENSDQITDESFALNALDTEGVKSEENDGIWTFLVDFDKAYALRYQLAKSLGNDCFLKSLNIDSRNVLKNPKKPTLPIFASQLGLLEPTRGSADGGGKDNTLDSSVAPTDSDSSIPAPEFDWNSSGLTNPLDKLEEQFLCKELTNNNSPVTNEVKFDPVQSILTQATRGASVPPNSTLNCTELSTTAQVFVDSLPDLSYMKARVLMFPIGHS